MHFNSNLIKLFCIVILHNTDFRNIITYVTRQKSIWGVQTFTNVTKNDGEQLSDWVYIKMILKIIQLNFNKYLAKFILLISTSSKNLIKIYQQLLLFFKQTDKCYKIHNCFQGGNPNVLFNVRT